MHSEEDDNPIVSKKKPDKGQASNDNSGILEKGDTKKGDKNDGDDPKPRIVLTFRSDKKNCNMKIVPNDEKHEEFSPRRSSRTRNKWEWSEEGETSISPKKDKNSSQSVSETDETSDSSHTPSKRSTRRRSKDSTENVLANAIARKVKSYNEAAPGPTQRLSRRIKPTAKILANEELRIGLETQNNARLGIQTDKPEEGVRTRKTRSMQVELEEIQLADSKKEQKGMEGDQDENSEDTSPEKQQNPNTVMKLKHLCELGLKAINPDGIDDDDTEELDEGEEDEDEEDEANDDDEEDYDVEDDDEEVEDDDDEEVISKLLEADEDSSEDFSCSVASSKSRRPRRSTRLCSSYGGPENDSPVPVDDEQKESLRRSSRRAGRFEDREYRPPRKKSRVSKSDEVTTEKTKAKGGSSSQKEQEQEDEEHSDPEPHQDREPAGGDEGTEPACPDVDSPIIATCFCEAPSKLYASPEDLVEPVFCQAVESVDGVRVGCSQAARRGAEGLGALVRPGLRAPFALVCPRHAAQLARHLCCPACGLYCTQGTFYQCSEGHLFHLECGLPYNDVKVKPGCPHCGVRSYRWQPVNKNCVKVNVQMKCSNKRIFLPDQREQCTPAYMSFTTLESPPDLSPIIPEDLVPSPPIDLKQLCLKQEEDRETPPGSPARRLCDAINAGETMEQLLPKITSRAAVNSVVGSGSSVHAAASRGRVAALYALHCAGADVDAPDATARTPLMRALQALFDITEKKSPSKRKLNDTEPKCDEIKEEVEDVDTEEVVEKDDSTKVEEKVSEEDLIRVIRFLIAAGCDVNAQGPDGMTALHMCAQHGAARACALLLEGGAAADARDHGGWTPLVWAAENGHAQVVRLLVSEGADAATCDTEGNGAVHWCALAGHAPVLRALLAAAPHAARAPNAHRDTPLHVAARQGHYACVVILLAQGARTDLENSAGELPVEVCSGACQSLISLNMQMALVVKDGIKRHKILSSDISNGVEQYPVACINDVDDEPLPEFKYVADHVMPEPLVIDNTIKSMQGCSCTDGDCSSSECACVTLSVRRWSTRGRLPPDFPYHDPPMLFECNATCACNKRKCSNMVISRLQSKGSIFVRAGVYRTEKAGWALRALAPVPRGSPVALYCGELLPLHAADARPNDQYLFALDVRPDLLEQCSEKTMLCVDACTWGSAARFANHSCRANLAPVRVFPAARDLRLPAVVLYATQPVAAGDLLTFDYGDKFWSVKSKWMECQCGTPECKYPVKTTDSDS